VIESPAAVPELDGCVLGGGEQEALFLRVPVDPIYGAGVGGNDAFLRSAAVAGGDVPEDDVAVAGPAGEEVAGGVLDTPVVFVCGCAMEGVRISVTKRQNAWIWRAPFVLYTQLLTIRRREWRS